MPRPPPRTRRALPHTGPRPSIAAPPRHVERRRRTARRAEPPTGRSRCVRHRRPGRPPTGDSRTRRPRTAPRCLLKPRHRTVRRGARRSTPSACRRHLNGLRHGVRPCRRRLRPRLPPTGRRRTGPRTMPRCLRPRHRTVRRGARRPTPSACRRRLNGLRHGVRPRRRVRPCRRGPRPPPMWRPRPRREPPAQAAGTRGTAGARGAGVLEQAR